MEIVFTKVAGIDVHKRQVGGGAGFGRSVRWWRIACSACSVAVIAVLAAEWFCWLRTPYLCGKSATRLSRTNWTGHDDCGRVLHPLTSIFRAAGVRDDLGWARPRDAR